MNEEKGKKLNIWNIIGLGLGGAIGSGIFVLLGFGIQYTGRSILLVTVVGCFFMLLAYWYNLAMPMMFVIKGGDYSMRAMMFNPLFTGMSAWMTLVNGFATASYAMAITQYICILFPGLEGASRIVSMLLVLLFFASTIRGSHFITIFENVITVVLVISLAVFVIFGVPQVNAGNFFSGSYDGGFFRNGLGGFISAVAVMGWACQGTTMAPVSLAAVTKDPKKTLPLGIIYITIVLAVIYGLMAYVAGGVLPYEEIAGQNLSVTAEKILPRAIFLFFVVGGGIGALASSLLGGLAMFRYPSIQVAEDGWLPAVFRKTDKNGYPYLTYGVFFIISMIPIVSGIAIDAAISLVMIPSMIMNLYMNLAIINLPEKYPEQWEKREIRFSKGLYKVCCILGAICAGIVAFNLFKDLNAHDAIISVIILAVMAGVSLLRLQQGAVKKEDLAERKAEIVREALEAENEV